MAAVASAQSITCRLFKPTDAKEKTYWFGEDAHKRVALKRDLENRHICLALVASIEKLLVHSSGKSDVIMRTNIEHL